MMKKQPYITPLTNTTIIATRVQLLTLSGGDTGDGGHIGEGGNASEGGNPPMDVHEDQNLGGDWGDVWY